MSASTNDKFKKVGASTVTTLSAPGKAIGDTSINVGSTTNFPSDTGIIIAIRVVDTSGNLVAGTYTEWSATVSSATSLSIVATPVVGSDQIYAAGSTTQVFIPVSSAGYNTMVDGILARHNQDGSHKTVTVAEGGTGATTAQTAADNILPSTGGWLTLPNLSWVSTDGPTQVLKITGADYTGILGVGNRIGDIQSQAIQNYWTFDTDVTDSKGSAACTNTGSATFTAGKFSNALTLNGSSQCVSITDAASLKPTDNFSIGCWIKTSTVSRAIFSSWDFSSSIGYGIRILINSSGKIIFNSVAATTAWGDATGLTTVTDGNWHYVVVSYRNNFAQIYVDGNLDGSSYLPTPTYHGSTNHVQIGRLWQTDTGFSQYFNGQIEDMFISAYAWDEQTIAAKYAANSAQGTADVSITKYAIISAKPTLSGSDTLVTVFSGTDYNQSNLAITSPKYSREKSPFGFSINPNKWKIEYNNGQATWVDPTAGVYINQFTMSAPIGQWNVYLKGVMGSYNAPAAASFGPAYFGIGFNATTMFSEMMVSQYHSSNVSGITQCVPMCINHFLSFSAKQTLYVNCVTTTDDENLGFRGDLGMTILRLTSTLL